MEGLSLFRKLLTINILNASNKGLLADKKYRNIEIYISLSCFALISYLLINTGYISDDYTEMLLVKDKNIKDLLLPYGIWLSTPIEHYTHHIWYSFFKINSEALVTVFKIVYICLSFYIVKRFFSIYLDTEKSFLASFLFIFFPTHDSVTYWYLGMYLTMTISFYLYAFYLAYYNKLLQALLLSFVASFLSYGSPPVAFALCVLFALNKEFKKAAIIIGPNIIYSIYYIIITKVVAVTDGGAKLPGEVGVCKIIKQFALQIVTFVDAVFGPSMCLKIYYSFYQLSVLSIVIGALVTVFIYKIHKKYKKDISKYNVKLVLSLSLLIISSFVMFSITGRYPQLAFNLGNETTIYSSLLISYLLVLAPVSVTLRTIFCAIMLFSILGVSDHWKSANLQRQQIISDLRSNQDLVNYKENKKIYISGNQYSKYGALSHLEFLVQSWTVASVVELALDNNNITATTINKNHEYVNGYLIDKKSNTRAEVTDYINVYDSEKDSLLKVDAEEINSYISSLPSDTRHWIQMLGKDNVIKKIVLYLMPRLEYAL